MAQNGGHLGVSQPLDLKPPTERDNKLSEELMKELKEQNNFEPPEETAKRNDVLKKLQKLLIQLVQTVGTKKNIPKDILKDAGGKVFTYGSYRLGVYSSGSDIDTLMVAPKFVTRDDFFEYMPNMIKKLVPEKELTEFVAVPGIVVPIIKLEMYGVSIDLIFSSVNQQSVPKTQELNDSTLLRGLSETDMRCLNGTRVTDRILTLVPETKTFRFALRAIKLWAQRRGIYGNVVGFPGGVAWAMMLARVCQLYPRAAAATIVVKFFFVMSRWSWPQPVLLQAREVVTGIGEREWDNVQNRGDRAHLMPVITPAYPCMNSTANIGHSQKAILVQELQRAHDLTGDIEAGKKPWKALFQRHTFFTQDYKHYICVITASVDKNLQDAWSGLVQSRLRRLITGIENSDADCVKLVHPFNKNFKAEHEAKNDDEKQQIFDSGLQHQVVATETTDTAADVKMTAAAEGEENAAAISSNEELAKQENGGTTRIWSTRFYLGIQLEQGKNNLDISQPITDFRDNCQQWDGYKEDTHSIKIKHVRNYDLPDDVFVDGETKPTRRKVKKLKEGTPATESKPAIKKRSLSNAGLDENKDPAKRRQSGLVSGAVANANGMAPNGITNGTAG